MKIVLTGGGTGGHIFPLISVARKIKEKNPDAEFMFIGQGGELEKKIMEQEGIPMRHVMSGKMRRYFSLLNIVDFFKIPIGIIQSLAILFWHLPDAIFSKGGYSSFPVVFAGWIYHVPILIHESDATPGLANSMLSKFADRVALSYPEAQVYFSPRQAVLTGTPLRGDIAKGSPENARKNFSLMNEKKTIFVWGGSQGAQIINDKIVEILPDLLKHYQVIHQTGSSNFEATKHRAGVLGIKAGRGGYWPVPFIEEELKDVLAVADLVISRAGGNSISEIAANGKPAILIPLENSANNHQRMNAYSVAKAGGCVVLEQNNLGANIFTEKINEIINDDTLRENLKKNIQLFYHPDASDKIAEGIIGMIK